MKDKIGLKIKQRRTELGITQHNLAEMTGYLQSTISHIETGHVGITLEQMSRIFPHLNMKITIS